jgi:outer membrane immunogenic protein
VLQKCLFFNSNAPFLTLGVGKTCLDVPNGVVEYFRGMGGGMKRLFLSSVSLLALATVASAGPKSAPVPSVPTWAGFYLGLQGGVASHKGSFNDVDDFASTGLDSISKSYSASKTGGIFGANAGYNFQSGNLVYGVEGDWSWLSGVKAGTTTSNPCVPLCSFVTSYDVRWLATARARVGWAFDANLLYATGGAAFGNINDTTKNFFGVVPLGTFNQNSTKVGWTVGGGIEHMFGPNWTARGEVRYVDLGRSTPACMPGASNCVNLSGGSYRGEFRNSLLLGLLAVDYKF